MKSPGRDIKLSQIGSSLQDSFPSPLKGARLQSPVLKVKTEVGTSITPPREQPPTSGRGLIATIKDALAKQGIGMREEQIEVKLEALRSPGN